MEVVHLNQKQLAVRWSISEASLERWRSEGIGPRYRLRRTSRYMSQVFAGHASACHAHWSAENRERKTAECAPEAATSTGACSRGKGRKPRQHRGNGQKKSQPDKGWDFTLWWAGVYRIISSKPHEIKTLKIFSSSCSPCYSPVLPCLRLDVFEQLGK